MSLAESRVIRTRTVRARNRGDVDFIRRTRVTADGVELHTLEIPNDSPGLVRTKDGGLSDFDPSRLRSDMNKVMSPDLSIDDSDRQAVVVEVMRGIGDLADEHFRTSPTGRGTTRKRPADYRWEVNTEQIKEVVHTALLEVNKYAANRYLVDFVL